MSLLDVKPYDREFYETELRPWLPKHFIDCHNHIWKKCHILDNGRKSRSQNWPSLVAGENPIEDLILTNEELFPENRVTSVLYGKVSVNADLPRVNEYVAECARRTGFPALYVSHPSQSADEVERDVLAEPLFRGLKVYLSYAPEYIPADEIRIFDFLTHEHLALADRHGWVVQLHIPRPGRLGDPVNFHQIREIEERYPNLQLIVAHLGRAYSDCDVGDALEYLAPMEKTVWDFTANTNQNVMERVLEKFGPERFIYGSDFPIFRMKARRHTENGTYINEIPKGSLGTPEIIARDPHMREIDYPEAEKITFFIYEEMASAIRAMRKLGFGKTEIHDIFYGNSARIFGVKGD